MSSTLRRTWLAGGLIAVMVSLGAGGEARAEHDPYAGYQSGDRPGVTHAPWSQRAEPVQPRVQRMVPQARSPQRVAPTQPRLRQYEPPRYRSFEWRGHGRISTDREPGVSLRWRSSPPRRHLHHDRHRWGTTHPHIKRHRTLPRQPGMHRPLPFHQKHHHRQRFHRDTGLRLDLRF